MPYAIPFVSRHSLTAALLIGLSYASAIAASPTPQPAKGKAPSHARLSQAYGKLPLSFEANRGQTDPSIQFLSHGQRYTLFLRSGEAVLSLQAASPTTPANSHTRTANKTNELPASQVDMQLVGANPQASAATEDMQIGKTNYFLGNDPTKWLTDIPNYAKIRYTNVYRGIDLVYYGNGSRNQAQLEFDFVVAPGASPDRIRLRFPRPDSLRISPKGDLLIAGSVALRKPDIYQRIGGHRKIVSGSFQLLANNAVSFSVARYDRGLPLIIDPVLVYSTYLGGSTGDQGNGIAVDASGNAYVVGTTYSTDFPITTDAHQGQNLAALAGHGSTVFVTKLNPAGTALVYSTYLGGSGTASGGDFGYGIALDAANNVYVVGATYSHDFPVTCDGFQATNPSATSGATTGFVTRLNATGNGLAYSTYLGGSGNQTTPAHGDVAQAVAVSPSGNAYVTGYTWSANFPTTDLAFQSAFAGSATASNAFVTELNPGGTALAYSTYLGGSGGDYGNAIAIDASGDAFVAGSTSSSNFPVTTGTVQPSLQGSSNAFIAKLKPDGTDEIYATYLGGNGQDSATAIAIDGNGFVYVAGNTNSSNFPVTAGVVEGSNVGIGAYYGSSIGGGGAFASKLDLDATTLEYSTYLEGESTSVTGLAVDSSGNAYIAGSAQTVNAGSFFGFQTTPDALPVPTGGSSAILVKLDPAATTFSYATLLGGSINDQANGLALDAAGNVYLTGAASSIDFPISSGAFQTTNRAQASHSSNAFVSKFALATEANQTAYPALTSSIGTTIQAQGSIDVVCPDDEFGYDGALDVVVSGNIVPNTFGPPPTGIYQFEIYGDETWPNQAVQVGSSWGSSSGVGGFGAVQPPGYGPGTFQANWSIFYYGDPVYVGSSTYGTASASWDCVPPTDASGATQKHFSPKIQLHLQPAPNGTATLSSRTTPSEPKFIPPPAIPRANGERPIAAISTENQAPACTAPLTPLAITLKNSFRLYGASMPTVPFTVAGLRNGDSVTVVPLSMATPASPVGAYPVTASVSGAAAANYAINILPATLQVNKAPLYISADSTFSVYGQTPPQPTAYTLHGFVNGDTASQVSGAPLLTTPVTSTTLPGFYKIGIQTGTLSAANYYFVDTYSGEGEAGVHTAPLQAIANNQVMHQGGPVPQLTYTLTSFVNEDTAANSVTGAPNLYTTATSSSPPGKYLISGTIGTLASAKYYFVRVTGTMTVLP